MMFVGFLSGAALSIVLWYLFQIYLNNYLRFLYKLFLK